jgi:hypothetical protein
VGEIQLASLSIAKNSGGSPSSFSGRIALGPGEVITCTDIIFGDCDGRKHLSGLLVLNGVPSCDARSSGNLTYYAANLYAPIGVTQLPTPISVSAGGNLDGAAATNSSLDSAAPPCDTSPPTDNPSPAPEPPAPGNPTGPDPDPQPWVPTGAAEPYAPRGGPPVVFFCSGVTISQIDGDLHLLLVDALVCYPG